MPETSWYARDTPYFQHFARRLVHLQTVQQLGTCLHVPKAARPARPACFQKVDVHSCVSELLLLVQVTLCSVSGDIFSSPVAAQRQLLGLQAVDEDQVQYLRRLLVPILQWVSPPQAALQQADTVDEAELLDACRCCSRSRVLEPSDNCSAAWRVTLIEAACIPRHCGQFFCFEVVICPLNHHKLLCTRTHRIKGVACFCVGGSYSNHSALAGRLLQPPRSMAQVALSMLFPPGKAARARWARCVLSLRPASRWEAPARRRKAAGWRRPPSCCWMPGWGCSWRTARGELTLFCITSLPAWKVQGSPAFRSQPCVNNGKRDRNLRTPGCRRLCAGT